jgi:hypothetical protein
VDAILSGDFALGHEFDGGAEGVADGKAKEGRKRPILQAQGRHSR